MDNEITVQFNECIQNNLAVSLEIDQANINQDDHLALPASCWLIAKYQKGACFKIGKKPKCNRSVLVLHRLVEFWKFCFVLSIYTLKHSLPFDLSV